MSTNQGVGTLTRNKPEPIRIGPLRIFIGDGDPEHDTFTPICLGIVHALTQICIGAINMTVMAYSMKFKDSHAILCTLGYHFFMAQAILSLNNTNGWSVLFSTDQKKFTHLFLQMVGMILSITGTVIILMSKGMTGKVHCYIGLVTLLLQMTTFLLGPIALYSGPCAAIIHITFAIPTFVVASLTVAVGVTEEKFQLMVGPIVPFIIAFLIFYFTTFIMVMTFIKYVMRIKCSHDSSCLNPPPTTSRHRVAA